MKIYDVLLALLLAWLLFFAFGCRTVTGVDPEGTPSKGYYALVDIDCRSPEQITAAAAPERGTERALPPSFWVSMVQFLTEWNWRLRIGVLEWDTRKPPDYNFYVAPSEDLIEAPSGVSTPLTFMERQHQ